MINFTSRTKYYISSNPTDMRKEFRRLHSRPLVTRLFFLQHKMRRRKDAPYIAFMYSLYESCKLNDLNFFDYINDVLTRLMKGETDYKSLTPCRYMPLSSKEEQKEVA